MTPYYAKMWDPMEDIELRMPDVHGSLRMKLVIALYGVKMRNNEKGPWFKVSLWDSAHKPRLIRSQHNNRRQDSVVKQYAKGILISGVSELMRGTLLGIQSHDDLIYMIAGASIIEAVYAAEKSEPNNVYITYLKVNGINIIVLATDIPTDVIKWIKNEHNQYHLDATTHFIEVYEGAPRLKASWDQHTAQTCIRVVNCPKHG